MNMKWLFCMLVFVAPTAYSQVYPPQVNFTAQQDREHMMTQLGIKKLRPGASGDSSSPNRANSDQSLTNPYPDYP